MSNINRVCTILLILALVLSLGMLLVPSYTVKANGGITPVYVSGTTGNDAWDGSSPLFVSGSIGPKKTIQAGFSAVSDSGTIRVAAGTYSEHFLTFNRTVAIIGTYSNLTIIDAGGGDWNAIQALGGVGGTVWLSGVTIQNGNYGSGPGGLTVGVGWTVIMNDCVIKNNTGRDAGGIYINPSATLQMNRCTISGNHATRLGTSGGGGMWNMGGTATLTNCTISGNDAPGYGGGIRNDNNTAKTDFLNCTIASNQVTGAPGNGGGFFNATAGATMTFKNCIVANNTATGTGNNGYTILATTTSFGTNLDSENSCGFNQPGDKINIYPLLGPLQDNGGSLFTHALLSGSPAIDAGNNSGAPTTDERLVPRPQGSTIDIGAYELTIPLPVATATGTGTATFNTDKGFISGLIASNSTPCGTLIGSTFPNGFFSFTVFSVTPGSTVVITITLPSNMPTNTQYWKCINGQWVNVTSLLGDNDGDNVLTLTITDGGLGDADGQANGVITDPGGPATRLITPPTPSTSSSDSSYLPERVVSAPAKLSVKYLTVQPQQAQANQPVTVYANIANSGDEAGSYTATLKINGITEQTVSGRVGGRVAVPLKFEVLRNKPGTYNVDINGQQASFNIIDDGGKKAALTPTKDWALIGFFVCAIGVIVGLALVIRKRFADY